MPPPPTEPAEPVVASIRPDGDALKAEEKGEGVTGVKQEEAVPCSAVPAVAVAEIGDEAVIAATDV